MPFTETLNQHVSPELLKKHMHLPLLARGRNPTMRVHIREYHRLIYPLPYYNMWRGNHDKYKYTNSSLSHFGEGQTANQYHQHYTHAKCPTDYGKGGREFEYLSVKRGKLVQKPLPTVQYVNKDSKPMWLFKSWHGSLGNNEIWQREVQYPEHVPDHLGCKRPLSVLAPRTMHKSIHAAHIDRIIITVCPFMFGFGRSVQQAVLGFYRRALSARSPIPNDKIHLYYSLDLITPRIQVVWVDGSVYEPPVLDGVRTQDLIQMVMEQSWLAGDRISAKGIPLQPLVIDDYKWTEMALKKQKQKIASGKK